MAKFYTFRSDYSSPAAPHPRLLRVNLDARGAKAMPQPCVTCHGGKLRPLDRLGQFVRTHTSDPANQVGDTKARLQAFEVDTFEFSDQAGQTQNDYEDGLRQLNLAIYCSYPGSDTGGICAAHGGGLAASGNDGEWSGDFAREMLLGWYGGTPETMDTDYDGSFIPAGWDPANPGIPAGADSLFEKVVGPNCFVCHGKRGTELGSNSNVSNEGKDLDFSSWDKFISHATEIERLVFDEGRMPLGLLNYDNFWNDPQKSELLGSFIAPFVTDFAANHTDAAGNIIPPGRVVARAGPDRVTKQGAPISLNAQASLFANSYAWTLVSSPAGSVATIATPASSLTDFEGNMDGDYVIQLTARDPSTGWSGTDQVTVKVDGGLPKNPRELSFYSDIQTIMNDECITCHMDGGDVAGIPVWWTGDTLPTIGTPLLGLYERVRTRVNLEVIEDSLVLKKPSNTHHYGGLISGFDTSAPLGTFNRVSYDMFVNWIAEGAVCGGNATQCPAM